MKISEHQIAIVSVTSIIGLLCIWVVPNTIALRHILLFTACISSIGLICRNWYIFREINIRFLPLFSVFSLFVWLFIHYNFFSLNPELELSEIKGLWMRSLLGAISAVGLGIAIVRYPKLRLYFYIALFATPSINVISYCWASYLNHGLLNPKDFIFFLFAKIETAYFGAIATAVAVGNLIYLLVINFYRSKIIQIIWWVAGLILVLVSALISDTKNGIAITLSLAMLLAVVVIFNSIFNKRASKFIAPISLAIIVVLCSGLWESHKLLARKGWDTVFQDAALGLNIDANKQWQKAEGTVPLPMNILGVPAASSTYTRFAYAAVGIRLLTQYPMGYGSINDSFKGIQVLSQTPHEHQGQVHSGWIDFGLAFGVPGLILVFFSMMMAICLGLKDRFAASLPWVIVFLALIPFGLIAEISYKQYFEATIFFLSLGSTVIALSKNEDH